MSKVRRPGSDVEGRRRDAAFLLPALCLLILLPPFVNLFVREMLVWGLPLEVVYLFGVWIVLVVGAMVLARKLGAPEIDGEDSPATPNPGAAPDGPGERAADGDET